jgi:CspA family cold shock protein
MAIGKIKWFDTKKGFGFISPDDGSKDAFLHVSALQAANISSVKDGQAVEYELTEQRGKMAASNIKIQGE